MIRKISILFSLITIAPVAFAQYESKNISLLSVWDDTTVVAIKRNIKYSACYGYYDASSKKEYAIIGSTEGTHIVEITDPTTPIRRGYVKGRRGQCTWREYKTYKNYLYMISDDASPNSLQIADLSYLPDSVHLVHDDNTIIEQSHTHFIDGNKWYCASPTGGAVGYSAMAVFSLKNPEKPQLLRKLEEDSLYLGHIHDMFVRNDTIYASAGFGGLHILKLTSDNKFSLLGSLTKYAPDSVEKYNHSSYLTPDGKTLVFADEIPNGLPVKIADVSDVSNIIIIDTFRTNIGATPHNPYILNNFLILSYYEDGVQIYDISNPAAPFRVGFFDTYPQNGTTYKGYNGCWGAYPYLPSGVIIASDRQNGLFILDAKDVYHKKLVIPVESMVSPNPFFNEFQVQFYLAKNQNVIFQVFDLLGREIYSEKEFLSSGNHKKTITLPANTQAAAYLLKVQGENEVLINKLIKI